MKPFHQTEVHKKKLKKNLAVIAIVMAWCAAIWAVTMIKMAGG